LLLEHGADRTRRDRGGSTPLENAARARHASTMEILIAPGAADSGVLLVQAAIKNQTDIADLLLAKGVDVNARDQSGATSLHLAALKGYTGLAKLLLEHGAEVNARDGDGATPLHNAAVSGYRELAALLLDHGADREARDTESGATPLYQAASWGRTPVVELLLSRGAEINAKNKSGVTPLQAAEKNGFAETAALLKRRAK
jgi:ankyrin repeat protein